MNIAFLINTASTIVTLVALVGFVLVVLRTAYNPNSPTLQAEVGRGIALQMVELARHAELEDRFEDATHLYESAMRIYSAVSDWSAEESIASRLAKAYYEYASAVLADGRLEDAGKLFKKSMNAAAQAGDKDSEIAALQQMMSVSTKAGVKGWLENNKDLASLMDKLSETGLANDWRTKAEQGVQKYNDALLEQYTGEIRRRQSRKQKRFLYPILILLAIIFAAFELWLSTYAPHTLK